MICRIWSGTTRTMDADAAGELAREYGFTDIDGTQPVSRQFLTAARGQILITASSR